LFRHAENSYFRALAADKIANPQERAKELARLLDETAKRYQQVIDKASDAAEAQPLVNLARHGLGLTSYPLTDRDKARQAWDAIAEADRNGELAVGPYLMADCLLRQVPAAVPEDALAAGKMEDQLKTAAGLLEAFTGATPNSPQAADALLKLGLCHQKLAAV